MTQKDEIQFEKGSGNVFADLGFADPEKEQLKAHLAFEIHRVLKEKKWTQRKIGEVLGIAQPHVSDLMRAQPTKFSVNRLMGFLTKLDQDVEIRVRPKAGREAQITVQPR
ncbi:MAG: helix-turn-helix domain-containing protein [Sphingomonadales bacterium]|nr:helix-turn-helix domain-containing protein [Sphingomonadales bacterium]